MSITNLSTEILQHIFEYAELEDLVHLAQTSRRNYRAFLGRRMPLLQQAMHNSYSPVPSLLKLVISNETDKTRKPIGTEVRINNILERMVQAGEKPKLTLELMKKMVHYGRIAERWTELYPRLRWRFGSDNRRLLKAQEKDRLRGAIYHHWTYTTLFHSRSYTQYSPDPPSASSLDDPRHRLLRTYSTTQHIQLSEFLSHVEQLVELDLYPSYTVVHEQYAFSLSQKALYNIAWGDGSEYRRLVRDIMKLSPADILHLVENTTTKSERADFLCAQGVCFGDVPATMNYALSTVRRERARCLWGADAQTMQTLLPFLQPVAKPDPEEDFDDEDLMFGIVTVKGREKYAALEGLVMEDKVATGEWDRYREAV